jgi:hypothetical protein
MREEIGDLPLMADANQVWDVDQAIEWMGHLTAFDLRWIEEPTSPDDILGHAAIRRAVAPVGVATGEHAANRVIFKQLLQAGAIDYCQIDACRLGGVNEVLAVLLLAARFGVPVCPHAGGLGLCEYVQHLSIIDYVCVSGSLEDRTTEYADHLHEHFVHPARIRDGRYVVPTAPGYSIDLHPSAYAELATPTVPCGGLTVARRPCRPPASPERRPLVVARGCHLEFRRATGPIGVRALARKLDRLVVGRQRALPRRRPAGAGRPQGSRRAEAGAARGVPGRCRRGRAVPRRGVVRQITQLATPPPASTSCTSPVAMVPSPSGLRRRRASRCRCRAPRLVRLCSPARATDPRRSPAWQVGCPG